jgi:transposase
MLSSFAKRRFLQSFYEAIWQMEADLVRYSQEIEHKMQKFYNSLSEKDRRRYAAMEAIKLGHGGISYIAQLLGSSRDTIRKAIQEIESLTDEYDSRIRKPGGGRKPYTDVIEGIDEAFLDVVSNHTAGEPNDRDVRWTNLTHDEIAELLERQHGIKVSETVIRQLLRKHNFTKRKAQKKKR